MSNQRSSAKSLIITDDEVVEELNPFSYKEFLRWKSQDAEPDQEPKPGLDLHLDLDLDLDLDLEHTQSQLFGSEARSSFLSEPSLEPQAEQETDWGRSFQSGVDSTSSICTEEEEEEEEEEETRFSTAPEVQRRDGQGRGGVGGAGGENYEGDDETSMAEPAASCRRRSGRSSQIKQLQEENQSLRRSLRELQRRSQANEHRVLELSQELLLRRRQEEKEAQDLESMVQSVEQNLHLMTKRAVKAESSVSRLKTELQKLQEEADSLQSENVSLKAAESEAVLAMRHNAQVASEYLNKTASHAHSSIRQLLEEAETLRFVSQLLQSMDKISSVDRDS
ncbi:endosome-associated-trafficking regulator 1 isoform X2 [Nelusetta ayraudi]|uniref:endosome-associated-trafficking regulator 1 isoform X2 n=1 Tax=Nelusetta ayraudi TaxID=303726 RepID=UPI003F704E6C